MPNKNKRTKLKKAVAKKTAPKRKTAPKKKVARKSAAPKKSSRARKRALPKKKRAPAISQGVETAALRPEEPRKRRGGQSGDLQGLSRHASADSESVDELLEEGNALEAEVVQGVENAPDADQGEVRTHEVPEDDVPQEYLDKE